MIKQDRRNTERTKLMIAHDHLKSQETEFHEAVLKPECKTWILKVNSCLEGHIFTRIIYQIQPMKVLLMR